VEERSCGFRIEKARSQVQLPQETYSSSRYYCPVFAGTKLTNPMLAKMEKKSNSENVGCHDVPSF
jgi:hypothetical protein